LRGALWRHVCPPRSTKGCFRRVRPGNGRRCRTAQ